MPLLVKLLELPLDRVLVADRLDYGARLAEQVAAGLTYSRCEVTPDNLASTLSALVQAGDLLVNLPDVFSDDSPLQFPAWAAFGDPLVWKVGAVIAVVGSVETLLCLEAIDKLDKYGRESPKSRELLAQGAGNAVAGLLGGLIGAVLGALLLIWAYRTYIARRK